MAFRFALILCATACCGDWLRTPTAEAQDAAPLVRMLKSGRLPPERVGNVLGLVFQRGNAEDLAYIFERAVEPNGFPPEARVEALAGLAAAAETRKVQPEFDPQALAGLISDRDIKLREAALRLAGTWRVEKLAPALEQLATGPDSTPEARRAALAALVQIGGEPARQTADKLANSPNVQLRVLGIAAMADFDLDQAATRAAALLGEGVSGEQTRDLLAPFLERQGATDQLAAALQATPPSADAGKLALRYLYAAGRSDAALVEVLSHAAGLNAEPPQLDAEQLKALSAEVLAKGDPHRGEKIFRRADLSCFKCHALSGAGGDIGPDLSPVGTTSPPDYIITSILNPDLSIKETFITRAIVTDGGKIYQGIVADRDEQRVVLKEATGEKITIPVADIADEVEGKSLMPKGLAGFLTHQEFLDLVRFVSSLGKPGEYEVRSKPTVQRWLALREPSEKLLGEIPAPDVIRAEILTAPESSWLAAYAQVAGVLPLDEVAAALDASQPPQVIYLRADLNIIDPGEIEIQLDNTRGIQAWIDDVPLKLASPIVTSVTTGPHQLLLRVSLAERGTSELSALVDKAHGSTTGVTIVGGR